MNEFAPTLKVCAHTAKEGWGPNLMIQAQDDEANPDQLFN